MSGRPNHHSDASSSSRGRSPALIPLTDFGKYRLVARLGRGGMAEVFLAFVAGPAGFRKPVVIKRILADLQSDDRLVQMFFDEARLVARLNHPHVVQTYEVGELEGRHFLAMEYLEGQPLHRVLRVCARRHMTIPPSIAVRIAVDALDALQYAHDLRDFDGTPLGVVHRDVSPQNIFVTYDGVVKLLDFGIAKSVTQVVQTRTGAIKGKYAYISPEQARGGDVDARADLWAMGIVLWESLVGQRLFKGETDIATLEASLRGPIPRLSEALPGSSSLLCRVLDRALSRDRDKRYPTALAMKEDLEQFLRQEPAPVGRAELSRYVRKLFADVVDDHRRLLSVCMENVRTGQHGVADAGGEDAGETVPETPPSMDSHVRSAVGETSGSDTGTPSTTAGRAAPFVTLVLLLIACGLGGGVTAWLMGGGSNADEADRAETVAAPARLPPAPPPVEPGRGEPDEQVEPIVEGDGRGEPDEQVDGTAEVAEPEPRDRRGAPAAGEAPAAPRAKAGRAARLQAQRRAAAAERRRASEERAAEPEPEPEPEPDPPRPRPPAAAGTGRLTLDTVPWSEVLLNGRVLGTTPLLGVEVPAGTHVLTLRNPEQSIETQYRVRIEEGETTVRRLGL